MIALVHGLLFDGTGAPARSADLLLEGERILAIGSAPQEVPRIDCAGLAIAPGFIDLHSHSDLQALEDRQEKRKQGVTTEVVGNCGFSPFPHEDHLKDLQEFAAPILGRGGGWGWPRASDYLAALRQSPGSVRAIPLVGHGSLRVAVAGLRQGPLSSGELSRMEGLLEEALDEGCAGFSTGLMYAPGSSAPREELERLCAAVARKGKLHSTHMRSYASGLPEAVGEQLELAQRTGCRLQISHLQAAGRGNWDRQRPALDRIEAASQQGIDVEFDIYPYQCGSTVLTQWLPQWSLEGGTAALLRRLGDETRRRLIREEMERSRAQEWSDLVVSSVAGKADAGWIGRALPDADTALDLLREADGAVNVISFNQSESNLRELLTHPLCSVVSDGFYVTGKAHPRLYGTFPELLGEIVRERRWMSLAEAIHKITARPASRLGWTDRGRLGPGQVADLTVFDPALIRSRSSYDHPEEDPEGIRLILQNGIITYDGRR